MKLHRITQSRKEHIVFPLISEAHVRDANDPELWRAAKASFDHSNLTIPEDAVHVTIRPLSFEERAVLAASADRLPGDATAAEKVVTVAVATARKAVKKVVQQGQEFDIEDLLDTLQTDQEGLECIVEILERVNRESSLGKAKS